MLVADKFGANFRMLASLCRMARCFYISVVICDTSFRVVLFAINAFELAYPIGMITAASSFDGRLSRE